ncbi:MAG: hypothetical protein PHQ47_00170, partial [Candidatus Portnoybacteria bacterium]|nr:hypothetical protein [Candidatus Portnoybacteria bacterium]
QTFNLASWLITQGAEKEKIIKALYKTKPLNQLKLWGRLLGGLEWQNEKNIAWLETKNEDFTETQTSPKDLLFILEEVKDLLPQLKITFIFYYEETGIVSILAHSPRTDLLQKLHLELGGTIKNSRGLFKIAACDATEAKQKISALLTPLL